jgi:hypothetical protein
LEADTIFSESMSTCEALSVPLVKATVHEDVHHLKGQRSLNGARGKLAKQFEPLLNSISVHAEFPD